MARPIHPSGLREASPSASGQLVSNAGQCESARSGVADHARDGETAKELRARVKRTILEDLEAKVLALRALHAKLRGLDSGERFGDVVARGRPKGEMRQTRGRTRSTRRAVPEFRLRILDVRERVTDPPSFLGIVGGFPQILTHSTSVERAERDLVNALEEHVRGPVDREATRLQRDGFPTGRALRLGWSHVPG